MACFHPRPQRGGRPAPRTLLAAQTPRWTAQNLVRLACCRCLAGVLGSAARPRVRFGEQKIRGPVRTRWPPPLPIAPPDPEAYRLAPQRIKRCTFRRPDRAAEAGADRALRRRVPPARPPRADPARQPGVGRPPIRKTCAMAPHTVPTGRGLARRVIPVPAASLVLRRTSSTTAPHRGSPARALPVGGGRSRRSMPVLCFGNRPRMKR